MQKEGAKSAQVTPTFKIGDEDNIYMKVSAKVK
jgi:hypothetical protein